MSEMKRERRGGIREIDHMKRHGLCLLLCLLLSPLICACGGSSDSAKGAGAIKVNDLLAYVNPGSDTDSLMPHQTVVIKRRAASMESGGPYQILPYEIINSGYYKFCVPDDDSHIDRIEIMDVNGAELANWRKGGGCESAHLAPGHYTMHIHHAANDKDLFLFIKPHAVTAVEAGSLRTKQTVRTTTAYTSSVPSSQIVKQEKSDYSNVIDYNGRNGITEKWGLSGDVLGGYVHFLYPGYNASDSYNQFSENEGVERVNRIESSTLVTFPDDNTVMDSEGRYLAVYDLGYSDYDTTDTYLAMSADETDAALLLPISMNGASFDLMFFDDSEFVWCSTDYSSMDYSNGGYSLKYSKGDAEMGGDQIETFTAVVRTGTVSGKKLPALISGDVALFDRCYGESGFSGDTTYWIINGSMSNFEDFSFNNPKGKIYTVMADRGMRAKLYDTQNYQGNLQYVSPPKDGELILTCADSEMLQNGDVNSIYLETNTGDITANEYEHHIIVSTNVCIGCDLRGFSMTDGTFKSINFTNSDLSNSDFTGATLSVINMTNVIADNSVFTNSKFENCNLTGASFKNATFQGAGFTIDESLRTSDHAELAYQNSCPNFDGADFTGFTNHLDDVFPVNSEIYNGDTWWNNDKRCMTSMINVTIDKSLFTDNRLWQFVNASQTDFSGIDISGIVMNGNVTGAVFTGATMKNAVILYADLTGTNFSGTDLSNARINGTRFSNPLPFDNTTVLAYANLSGSIMNSCDLSNLDLNHTTWYEEKYTPWDRTVPISFEPASLFNSVLYNTKLNNADLTGADLTYISWYGDNATGEYAALGGAQLDYANLPGLDLNNADVNDTSFDNAVLVNAKLNDLVSMDGASFSKTDLRGASLGGATSLKRAQLSGATISITSSSDIYEVMTSPPSTYAYITYDFDATVVPASSANIDSCPSGSVRDGTNDCGPVEDGSGNLTEYWIPMVGLDILTGCDIHHGGTVGDRGVDSNGDYLQCQTSQRHPKGSN